MGYLGQEASPAQYPHSHSTLTHQGFPRIHEESCSCRGALNLCVHVSLNERLEWGLPHEYAVFSSQPCGEQHGCSCTTNDCCAAGGAASTSGGCVWARSWWGAAWWSLRANLARTHLTHVSENNRTQASLAAVEGMLYAAARKQKKDWQGKEGGL